MKFNVMERVTLLGILPPTEGSYLTYKILTNLKTDLSFSEKDHEDFGLRQQDGMILWDKSDDKEVEVGDQAREIIKESLKKLDEAGKITPQNATLYERFMLE